MGAPEHVTNELADQPRRGLPLPPSRRWSNDRPAALGTVQPTGPTFGNPGPDQGFGLVLAKRFEDELVLAERESKEDAVAGCLGVGLARAALFGRAPVIHDMTVAYSLWGFLSEAPAGLIAHRRPLFQGAAHHYWDQRAIVDRVPETTLRLPHGIIVKRSPADWQELLGLS